MPIRFPSVSVQDEDRVNAEASHLMPRPRSLWFALLGQAKPKIDFSRPHRLYTVPTTAVSQGELLSAAEFTGWRYFVLGTDGNVIGEMEMDRSEESGEAEVHPIAFYDTPFAAESAAQLHILRDTDVFAHTDAEVRFLNIPGIYFAGLWLHGSQDWIVPVGQPPAGLERQKLYLESDVIDSLQPVARRALEFHRQELEAES